MLLKNIYCSLLLTLCCWSVGQAQFLNLYGNEEDNVACRVKYFDGAIYTLEEIGIGSERSSLFSKYDLEGNVIWRIPFEKGTSLSDFTVRRDKTVDRSKVFMLVGRTLPSDTGVNNESILARIVDAGDTYTLTCLHYYQQGNREGFNKIQYREEEDDFLILGVDVVGASIRDNIYLLTVGKDCDISAKWKYEIEVSKDPQFYNSLLPTSDDGWLLTGNNGSGGAGMYVRLNEDLSVESAYEINSFERGRSSAINNGILVNDKHIVVGRIPDKDGNGTKGFMSEINSNGEVSWAIEIEESTNLVQIIGVETIEQIGGGVTYYFVMGRAMIDGVERRMVYKFRYATNGIGISLSPSPQLISSIHLEDGETFFSGGWLDTYESSGEARILYVDGRAENSSGFGGMDAMLGNLDLNLNSPITKTLSHTTRDFNLDFTERTVNRTRAPIPIFEVMDPGPIGPFMDVACLFFDCGGASCPSISQAISLKSYPYRDAFLLEVCSGDLAHFQFTERMVDDLPDGFAHQSTQWYYDDGDGEVPLNAAPFSTCGVNVPPGQLVECAFATYIDYDCASSSTGFVDRKYTVETTYDTLADEPSCIYRQFWNVNICCPISDANIELTPNLLCAGEAVSVNILLNSPDPFVQTPGEFVDIVWSYDGIPLGEDYLDQTNFTYEISTLSDITEPQQLCFKAVITNCNGKERTIEKCIMVDPEPKCGGIVGWPKASPINLNLISNSPHPIYTICSGNDAQIGIDPDNGFENCTPQWQYTFDLNSPNWIDMGFSNNLQNTNILPTDQWTGNEIYYRIKCTPLSNPSGCEPCYSDTLTIRLQEAHAALTIAGTSKLCRGELITLNTSIAGFNSTTTWFCNGAIVGTGRSISLEAEQSACYWVENTDANACYVVKSEQYCVEVCEVVPLLSCPLLPNDCACTGKAITLSACDSFGTCSDANLSFEWYINGVLQNNTSCTITHVPPVSGATYTVVITDTANGCSASTEQTVLPCNKDVVEEN